LEQLSSIQLAEWEAYYQLEPFGEYQEFWRTGLLASMIANALRGKGQPSARPEDFIPETFKPPRPQQTKKFLRDVLSVQLGHFKKRDFLRRRRKTQKKRKK